jgi:uncharacterized protein (DUF58 family)
MDDHADLEMALSIANNKHDVVALKIYDEREKELPPIGLIKLKDAENGNYVVVDSSSPKTRKLYSEWWMKHVVKLDTMFKKAGVDYTTVNTSEDYVRSLMNLFKKRALKQ